MSMLEGAPWLLAHKSMLEVNKPKKVSLYGTDYVLWQDRTGRVNALPHIPPFDCHTLKLFRWGGGESSFRYIFPGAGTRVLSDFTKYMSIRASLKTSESIVS